ncbi:MAG: YggU family protein, partial [Candidatus Altiarchaeales archaeon]
MLECIREGKKGVLIDIRVIPNSKKEGLGYDKFGKRLRLRISSPATDGRANKQLI